MRGFGALPEDALRRRGGSAARAACGPLLPVPAAADAGRATSSVQKRLTQIHPRLRTCDARSLLLAPGCRLVTICATEEATQ
jgi:hypothetical protein